LPDSFLASSLGRQILELRSPKLVAPSSLADHTLQPPK
jgi:hypothetical protein